MFKWIIRTLRTIAETADKAADKAQEIENAWEKKKPELEDRAADMVAAAWILAEDTAEAIQETGARALDLSRHAYKAVKAWGRRTWPILQETGMKASTGLKTACMAVTAMATTLAGEARQAWAFRESMVAEYR